MSHRGSGGLRSRAVQAAVVAGLLLRLAFALGYWTGKPLTHDEREYLALAANVAQGRGFVADLPGEPAQAPPPGGLGPQQFGRAPGYPLFLAPLTWLDADLRAGRLPSDVPAVVQIAQALLGAVTIALIAAIVRRPAGDRAAAIAAWMAAIFPPLVWMPAYALSEALYAPLALAAVWWLGAITDRPGGPAGGRSATTALVLAGMAAGAGALVRPAMLFFLPLAALLLVRRSPDVRTGWRRAMLFGVVAAAAIAPWTLRNLAVHERVVLIASEGGVTFWTGNHREAIGEGDLAANPHLKRRNLEFRARHAGLSEEALEPLYYREALGFIAADPVWWLGLEARKLWYTWVPFGPSYRLHSPLYFWASAVSLLFVLPLAVIGLVQAPVGTRPAALLTLAASSVLVGLIFFPQERFRLPVLDPALLASASLMAARRGNHVV
jgi:4-amino-4-deoxy-L-arabinose transferase-like glycosyltransferase